MGCHFSSGVTMRCRKTSIVPWQIDYFLLTLNKTKLLVRWLGVWLCRKYCIPRPEHKPRLRLYHLVDVFIVGAHSSVSWLAYLIGSRGV